MSVLAAMGGTPPPAATIIVLLSGGRENTGFRTWFFSKHVPALAAVAGLQSHAASLATDEPDVLAAMSLSGGSPRCPHDIRAIEYLRGPSWECVREVYAGCRIAGAYLAQEYRIRPYFPQRSPDAAWPEPERVGLLVRPAGVSHEAAMRHWLHVHAPKALEHHTGLAAYSQFHVHARLLPDAPEIDGINSLLYWNLDALKYGHFSTRDSRRIILEDCAHFRAVTHIIAARRYVFRQGGPRAAIDTAAAPA